MRKNNIEFLIKESNWFLQSLQEYILNESSSQTKIQCDSFYSNLLEGHTFTFEEKFIILFALSPHFFPEKVNMLLKDSEAYKNLLSEVDYVIPTGNLIAKILMGDDINGRISVENILVETHPLIKEKILIVEELEFGEPLLSAKIYVSEEILDRALGKKPRRPKFGKKFPAQHLDTNKEWSDLILPKYTKEQLSKVIDWAKYGDKVLEEYGLKKNIKKGYRTLFYGPPGTGKSMTAALIGKYTKKEVYRVDLSMVISKYVGETEKNLASVFEKAEEKDWILFFDEADSLFGKRTQQNSAQDRYANQEVSYLLQRIENYDGIIIMATNIKENMDEAFTRRFQSMIYFPVPKSYQRNEIWQNSFSTKLKFEPLIDFKEIAEKYEISGGAIINVVRECATLAAKKGNDTVLDSELHSAIRNELIKENKRV